MEGKWPHSWDCAQPEWKPISWPPQIGADHIGGRGLVSSGRGLQRSYHRRGCRGMCRIPPPAQVLHIKSPPSRQKTKCAGHWNSFSRSQVTPPTPLVHYEPISWGVNITPLCQCRGEGRCLTIYIALCSMESGVSWRHPKSIGGLVSKTWWRDVKVRCCPWVIYGYHRWMGFTAGSARAKIRIRGIILITFCAEARPATFSIHCIANIGQGPIAALPIWKWNFHKLVYARCLPRPACWKTWAWEDRQSWARRWTINQVLLVNAHEWESNSTNV